MKKVIGIIFLSLIMGCQFSDTPDVIIEEEGIIYGLYPDTGMFLFYLKKEIPRGFIDQVKAFDE